MAKPAVNMFAKMRASAGHAPATPPPDAVGNVSAGQGAYPRPGRVGQANVTGYFDPVVKQQLRVLAAERYTTIQELLGEALNDLFAKYGKPEVVSVAAERPRQIDSPEIDSPEIDRRAQRKRSSG